VGSAGVRSGFVAVAGRPNVGKSTLVNALCGGKVAIVSDKPQTTRRRIFGIANGPDSNGPTWQLVLADLPGFQRPLDELTERMQKTVDAAFEEIDAVLFVLSARERIGAGDRFIASRVFGLGVPVIIALNKVDRLKAAHIAEQMSGAAKLAAGPTALAAGARFRADHPAADWVDNFHALHPVSAKTGDGIAALRDELVALLPEGPLYFPVEQRSDLSVEMQISELIREKALWLTRDEVPHALSAEVESIEDKTVTASILVETESQKLILVGKGGAMVKEIGTRARPEIEALLGHSVFLELRVKVRPKWRRDAATLERLGL
jgi:GTPase